MNDQAITCPSCGQSIPLSETLTHQLRQSIKKEYDARFTHDKAEWQEKEKIKLWIIAQQKAKEKMMIELKDKDTQLNEQKDMIVSLEKKELELRREKRLIEEARKKIELEVERRVDTVRKETIETVRKTQEDEYRLKMLEKEKQLDMMKKTIEELKRKSEQGSMQIQGEVGEESLKQLLVTLFPRDSIEDVPVGIRGADLVQTVFNNSGQRIGVILWESKHTKSFSPEWIKKLKSDQSSAKADVCTLVSNILPEGVVNFGMYDEGVWVTKYEFVPELTHAIRYLLFREFTLKQSLAGSGKKKDLLYNYLLSSDFRNKIGMIISSFVTQKTDLESEKRAMNRIWSKREKAIEQVFTNTTSFYGDLEGVIGDKLPKISLLELPDASEQDSS